VAQNLSYLRPTHQTSLVRVGTERLHPLSPRVARPSRPAGVPSGERRARAHARGLSSSLARIGNTARLGDHHDRGVAAGREGGR
jgi:hypothetical protein